jgi:hypothetical protein
MYADDFFTTLSHFLAVELREGLRHFEEQTGIQLYWADKEFFISRVDLMSAIIDTFDPEAYGLSRAEGDPEAYGLSKVEGVSENDQ